MVVVVAGEVEEGETEEEGEAAEEGEGAEKEGEGGSCTSRSR